MPDASYVQTQFLGGEWSTYAQGRMDHPSYKKAMNVCLNAIPIEEGACPRRSGTQFCATTRGGVTGRLVAFAFSASSPYNIEFTDGHMRFFDGVGLVFDQTGAQGVTSISAATPAVLTLPAVPWVTGDQVQFQFVNALAAQALAATMANKLYTLTQLSTSSFSLADAITGSPIDGATLGWLNGLLLTVSRILDLTTLYSSGMWSALRLVQAELNALLLHGEVQPQVLTAVPGINGGQATFSISPSNFLDGPYLDVPTSSGTGITLSAANVGTCNLAVANLTDVGPTGFATTDVGRLIRFFMQPPTWNPTTTYSQNAVVSWGNPVLSYNLSVSSNTGTPPGSDATTWGLLPSGQAWNWGRITAWINNSTVTIALDDPSPYTNLFPTWQMGVYSNTTGWPTCGCYHEGRFWLGGAVPNRFDASTSDNLNYAGATVNFAPTNPDGSVSDDSGISYTLNASDTNPIYWMMPGLQGIICGTKGGEWLVQASASNNVITPTSIQAHRVTKYGCANIEPRQTGLTTVFVQKYQRKLLEYLSDVFSGKFYGPNLSEFYKHLTKTGIKELAYQEELAPIVWARCGDGSFFGTTYRRISFFSSEPPLFNAAHRHQLGSGRTVESICVGPSPPNQQGDSAGVLETLSMITTDATGIRHVEQLRKLFDEDDLLSSAWFVDDAVVPAAAVTVTVPSGEAIQFSGLAHLNGRVVSVFAAGLDCGDFVVTNGSVIVPYGSAGGLFTFAYLQYATTSGFDFGDMAVLIDNGALTIPCVIGFTYTTQGQTLRPIDQRDAGAANGPAFAKVRRTHQFGSLVANSIGVSYGTDFAHLRQANYASPGGARYQLNQVFTGMHWNTFDDSYSFDSMLCWQVTRPYPHVQLAIGAFVNTQDR